MEKRSFLTGVRSGDPAATVELEQEVARATSLLLRRWCVPRFAHEECRNDALSRVWERIHAGVEPRNLPAFVFPQAQGALTSWLRDNRPRRTSAGTVNNPAPEELAGGGQPSDSGEIAELRTAITECASRLRPKVRRAWDLRYGSEPPLSASEVADSMRASRNTVLGWWKEATDQLRQCLGGRGYQP